VDAYFDDTTRFGSPWTLSLCEADSVALGRFFLCPKFIEGPLRNIQAGEGSVFPSSCGVGFGSHGNPVRTVSLR